MNNTGFIIDEPERARILTSEVSEFKETVGRLRPDLRRVERRIEFVFNAGKDPKPGITAGKDDECVEVPSPARPSDDPKQLQALAAEAADLRHILVGLTQQVRRMERHIKASLPDAASGGDVADAPRLDKASESEVDKVVRHLKASMVEGENIAPALRAMTVKHGLAPIARYYGMTNTALPPKDELVLNIITRMRQSVIISEGFRKLAEDTAKDRAHMAGVGA